MKRFDLVRHLEAHGCQLLREGANHTVYVSRAARKTSTVPATARSTTTSLTRSARTSRSLRHGRESPRTAGGSQPIGVPVPAVSRRTMNGRRVVCVYNLIGPQQPDWVQPERTPQRPGSSTANRAAEH